jgi:hypothetical protein
VVRASDGIIGRFAPYPSIHFQAYMFLVSLMEATVRMTRREAVSPA